MAKVNKKPGNIAQGVTIQNIVIRPVVRSTQDIDKWRNALKIAEALNPIRVPLYDLYSDIILDATLSSVIDKRVQGVTRTKLVFKDTSGKPVDEINKLIKLRAFRKLRKELRLSKVWGITVCELSRKPDGGLHVYSIPRKHIKPGQGRIVYEQYGQDGYDYREDPYNKYLVEVGEPDDLGLLLKAAPYVIYKRGGFGDWAQFAEVFGMPFREARYDGYNDTVRQQLQKQLEEAGSASYVILPKDAEFKLHESRNTANSGEMFDGLRKACNQEICILILGQTETTTSSNSSGYAQSKTHAEVEAQLNTDDLEEELGYMNEEVLPILRNLGYPVGNGEFFHEVAEVKLPKDKKAEIAIKIKNEGKVPISDDYFYEEFSIPKPDNYDELKRQQEQQRPPMTGDDPPDPDPENDPKPPVKRGKAKLSTWDRLRSKLIDFFDRAPFSWSQK